MTSVEPQGPDPLARSQRGFRHMDPIACKHGTTVKVFDSDARTEPMLWLNVTEAVPDAWKRTGRPSIKASEAHAHLTIAEATLLRDQLTRLIEGDL